MPEAAVRPAVWLVDKPAGPTSHDVVARVRRSLPRRTKVGHAGTLDPFATGLLVILVGSATRLSRYLLGLPKRYDATFQLGARSATLDPEGPITPGSPPPPAADIVSALAEIAGRDRQQTPAFSAVKVDGERLWKSARRGDVTSGPEREIEIHELLLTGDDPAAGTICVSVHCGSGTYVRQIAADVGELLGCGAYCAELRRTAIGPWDVAQAVAPDAVEVEGGIDLRDGLPGFGRREVNASERAEIDHGRPVAAIGVSEGPVAVVDDLGICAVAEQDGDLLRPKVVLR